MCIVCNIGVEDSHFTSRDFEITCLFSNVLLEILIYVL